jgi:DNA-binding winged helix-turn-helix (wHTH) protein
MPLRFGTARLDPDRRQLIRDGREQHLSPKAFDLLVALIRARPRVLARDDLMATVWPDTFVSDASLAALIKEVRAALGDSARAPHFIRTHHTVGYSFVADAVEESGTATRRAPGPLMWLTLGDRRCQLPQGETVIGRDPQCDLTIADSSISRQHARISVTGRQVTLEDLASKNGTRVDGTRIQGPTTLVNGATLLFGSVETRFECDPDVDSSTLTVPVPKA